MLVATPSGHLMAAYITHGGFVVVLVYYDRNGDLVSIEVPICPEGTRLV